MLRRGEWTAGVEAPRIFEAAEKMRASKAEHRSDGTGRRGLPVTRSRTGYFFNLTCVESSL